MGGRFAKAAACRTAQCNKIDPDFLDEAPCSYMSRAATEARSQTTAERISSHIGACRYRPPPGIGLRCRCLCSARKDLAGRFYQFLFGQATIGSYLRDKIYEVDSDRCWWWCHIGKRHSRFYIVARCPAWAGPEWVM